jgi:hypothetical protein
LNVPDAKEKATSTFKLLLLGLLVLAVTGEGSSGRSFLPKDTETSYEMRNKE